MSKFSIRSMRASISRASLFPAKYQDDPPVPSVSRSMFQLGSYIGGFENRLTFMYKLCKISLCYRKVVVDQRVVHVVVQVYIPVGDRIFAMIHLRVLFLKYF